MANVTTLIELLDDAVARSPTRAFLSARDGLRYRYWSTAELQVSVGKFAGHLSHSLGLAKGSRVLICAPNSPRTVTAHLGAMLAGLIVVPLDTDSAEAFVSRVMAKTEASALLTAGRTFSCGSEVIDIDTVNLETARPFEGGGPSADDIAEIVFTSGTTGDPKGTVLTHRNIVADIKASAKIFPPEVPMRLLSILPLSHMLEQTGGLYLPLYRDGTVHYASSRQPPIIARELARSRACAMIVVPRVLEMMLAAIELAVDRAGRRKQWRALTAFASKLPIDLRRYLFPAVHREFGGNLLYFMCGGATLPDELVRGWETLGIRVVEGYGSTECSPVIASNTYNDRRRGTVGLPLPGFETRISEDGELLVRSESVSSGYWKDPERTQAAFSPDGWFHTGDVVSIDPGGALRILVRLNDRIVLGNGQKVFPADVEAELSKEPGILECSVLAFPDARGVERIHAVIRAKPGVVANQLTAALRSANSRLARHQAIAGYTLWSSGEFPHTNLGKVKRSAIKAALLAREPSQTRISPMVSVSREDRLRQLLVEMTGKPMDAIRPETDLSRELGLDPVQRLELGAKIEAQMGVEVDEDRLSDFRTVDDLMQGVQASAARQAPVSHLYFPDWPLGNAARLARRGLQSAFLFSPQRLFGRPLRIKGQEHLCNVRGPALLIANHGRIDTVSVIRALPARLRDSVAVATAADDYYRHRIASAAASLLLNAFPFSWGGNVRSSLDRCGALVDRGWSILVYPEGMQSPDGEVLPFKSEIGVLTKGLRVPVIPVAIQVAAPVPPSSARWPQITSAAVRIGAAFKINPSAAPSDIAGQLRERIVQMLSEVD